MRTYVLRIQIIIKETEIRLPKKPVNIKYLEIFTDLSATSVTRTFDAVHVESAPFPVG